MRESINKFRRRARPRIRKALKSYLILFGAVAIFLLGTFTIWVSTFRIPTLDSFEERRIVESTKIYDKTGEIILYDVNQDIKRTSIPLESISRHAKNATIAIEDREFYDHRGIKPKAILRATFANLLSLEYSQGGSTLTQQVVKNALLSREKLLSRKIKEWALALKIEKLMSKDEILALYLNEMPYGGALYGIEEASQTYFGKSANDLSLAESAYLAAMLKAPSYFSPYGVNREKLEERKNLVLREMERNAFITREEYEKGLAEKVSFRGRENTGIRAPHFVFYVIEELEKKYGEEIVRNGGLRVVTTLDYKLQEKGEEIVKKFALENEKTFNAENASFVAIDPKTGGIIAMVGSRDYFDEEIQGNFNIATALRQPGSTFKPFVYATAFNKGFTPETVVFDVKTQFSTRCPEDNTSNEDGCYSPENYDNKYRGPITFRNALAQSVNIPSVKVLYLAGISDSIRLAEKMGIESLGSPLRYGLTLVLGGGEVSLLELTSAYGVFASEGVRNEHYAIQEVKDSKGTSLYEHKSSPENVLDRENALIISDILSDNVARAPAFGATSYLHFPATDVAVKTGTTDDYRDAWIIGYTPRVVVGAWAGNNDNTPMEKKVAGFIVAPMWRAYMDEILKVIPSEQFTSPAVESSFDLKPILRGVWQGGISYRIDRVSGKLATDLTPKETTQEYVSGGVHSILYWVDKDNPREPAPSNPATDPQFRYWEYGVEGWLATTGFTPTPLPNIPTDYDDVHTERNKPKISYVSEVTFYDPSSPVTITPSLSSSRPVKKVDYYLNDKYLGEALSPPFSFTFIPMEFGYTDGANKLKIAATDDVYNRGELEVEIFIGDQ